MLLSLEISLTKVILKNIGPQAFLWKLAFPGLKTVKTQ